MEKLAVDLEKVLDDFEKEQLHNGSSNRTAIGDKYNNNFNLLQENYSQPLAVNHRRPPFEPVNLSEADFSIRESPPFVQLQPNFISTSIYSSNNEAPAIVSSHVDGICSFSVKSKNFKPDLTETNGNICSSLREFERLERHLPDIALTDVEIKDEKIDIGFTKKSNNTTISTDSKYKINDVIEFPVASDISDQELHKYLKELEEEGENEEETTESCISSNDAPSMPFCDNQNKIRIHLPSQPENDYGERCEVEVKVDDSSNFESEGVSEAIERTTLSLNPTLEVSDDLSVSKEDNTKISEIEISTSLGEMYSTTIKDKKNTDVINALSETDGLLHEMGDNVSLSSGSEATTKSIEDDIDTGQATENISSDLDHSKVFQHFELVEEEEEEEEKSELNDIEFSSDGHGANENEKILSDNETCSNASINSKELLRDNDNIVSTSESYQVLDSRVAISTFKGEDYSAYASTSNNFDHDENCLKNEAVAAAEQTKIQRPDSLNLSLTTQTSEMSSTSADSGSLLSIEERKLGKEPPFWIPDSETLVCMHCQLKFTIVKRRHHCRACGLVLCSKCCDLKANLEYLGFEEARVCRSCHSIIERVSSLEAEISLMKRPNPNNPMEYCSTIPPPLQVGPTQPYPPSVLVPVVGVLKREGRAKSTDPPKQVIFSDGIRPGGDLTELDVPSEPRLPRSIRVTKRVGTPPANMMQHRRLLNAETRNFIPSTQDLPPIVTKNHGDHVFSEIEKPLTVEEAVVKFAINCNLFVLVKRVILDCCVNREVWCMTTEGLSCVGQDEIIFLLEVLPDEKYPPKDVFCMVNMLYQEAAKGSTVTEMSFAAPYTSQLFGSKEHGGFVFIRPTYQCVQKLLLPNPPYLIALLIHSWEISWARLFPIRLVLRLGAEYRYYPCPLVSIRNRPTLFTEVGHTIISLLADFRKYSYSLPTVRGLMIHMEDRMTTILLPKNRYDQVLRAMNNSGENVLAFAGNISTIADSHLVCIQSMQHDTTYTTQAINILNKPRQVTGASFVVFNGSLKQYGWTGKSNIVEDGLMVQIPSENMIGLRNALRQMQDYSIGCGPQSEEIVVLKWAPDDVNFNVGVKSCIDNKPLDGVPSIRVHNGTDYSGALRLIRWTEVFIIQSDDSRSKTGDTVNISKLAESIARATCVALVPLLDLLTTANLSTLAIRANIDPEKVGYEAGSRGERLPPLYMKSLDNEVITVINEAALSIREISEAIVLELVFKVMEQG